MFNKDLLVEIIVFNQLNLKSIDLVKNTNVKAFVKDEIIQGRVPQNICCLRETLWFGWSWQALYR